MNKPNIFRAFSAAVFGLFVSAGLAGCAAPQSAVEPAALSSAAVVDGQRGRVHEWAIRNDASAILSLQNGDPRLESRDENGYTPLHWAAEFGNAEAVAALLARGANVGARSKNDGSDVSEAARRIFIEHEVYTEEEANVSWKNDGGTPLHFSAYSDNRRVIAALLAAGADVYERDRTGESPLHAAAGWNAAKAIYELVAHGANVDARGSLGETPMHRAAGNGAVAAINELAIQGADVDARDEDAATPLHWAVFYSEQESMTVLIARGAEVDARSVRGFTPLHLAIVEKNYDAAFMLLKNRADINARADEGYTVLHLAARNNDTEAIEGLCELGANPDIWDVDGDTPLHWAAARDFTESIRSLVKDCKAEVNIENWREETPLDLAIEEDNQSAIDELLKHNAQRGPKS